VHSDKQYCLLLKPSLNTTTSLRMDMGPRPGAPACTATGTRQPPRTQQCMRTAAHTTRGSLFTGSAAQCQQHGASSYSCFTALAQATLQPGYQAVLSACIHKAHRPQFLLMADGQDVQHALHLQVWLRTFPSSDAGRHALAGALLHLLVFAALQQAAQPQVLPITCSSGTSPSAWGACALHPRLLSDINLSCLVKQRRAWASGCLDERTFCIAGKNIDAHEDSNPGASQSCTYAPCSTTPGKQICQL
jgi:hypothetical protein